MCRSLSRIIFLIVFIFTINNSNQQQLPPKLVESAPIKSLSIGSKLKLLCQVQEGSRPLKFSWAKNAQKLHLDSLSNVNTRYRIDSTEEDSLLLIDQLKPPDNANYTCSVSNNFGVVHQTTAVIVKGFYFFCFYYHFCSMCGAFSMCYIRLIQKKLLFFIHCVFSHVLLLCTSLFVSFML